MFVRLKFRKEGPVRFIGHLDLMRTMQKTFRRANIPIAYSEGFNPHQVFSFATALAVGVSSEGEYMDLKLTQEVPVEMLIVAINNAAPPGIVVTQGVVLKDKEPKAMAALAAASYKITQNCNVIDQPMINDVMAASEIIVQKKNKKGKINDFDLRPGIFNLELDDDSLLMTIAAGSHMNIKPEALLKYMMEASGKVYSRSDFHFHRIELYHNNDGFKPLLEPKLG